MNRILRKLLPYTAMGILMAAPCVASATLIESFESGTTDGWGIPPGNNPESLIDTFTGGQTLGVTDGSYSAALAFHIQPNYGQALESPSSMSLTSILSNASALSFDVYCPTPAAFGYYCQIDVDINNAATGFTSLDGYNYAAIPFSEATLTVPVSPALNAALAGSGAPTQIFLQIGGGGPGTLYFDNFRTTDLPEPASLSLLSVGGLAALRRRRH